MRNKIYGFVLAAAVLLMGLLPGTVAAQGDPAYVIYSGSYYMKHVKDASDQWVVEGTTTFGPECVWYSSNTNNYYFLDGATGYYLYAPHTAGGAIELKTLSQITPAIDGLDITTGNCYFYNWDHGLARGIGTSGGTCPNATWLDRDNVCWEVYWVMYDGTRWTMSPEASYNPPYDAATFRRVRITEHAMTLADSTGGLGSLSPLTITYTAYPLASQSLSVPFTAPITATVMPDYTAYAISEISCNDADWTSRICDTDWTNVHNFYIAPGSTDVEDHFTQLPSSVTHTHAGPSSWSWSLSGEGSAYLSFSDESQALTASGVTPTLYYRLPNSTGDVTATLKVVVTYECGVTQTRTALVTVKTQCGPPVAWVTGNTFDDVTVAWLATSDFGYQLRWRVHEEDGEGNYAAWSSEESYARVNLAATVTSYTLTGLEPETQYDFQVGVVCETDGDTTYPATSQTYTFTTKRASRVKIGGAVFGGGRVANVTGKTSIYIANADTISAVYGGNDIFGQVQGTEGSTVVVGASGSDYGNPFNQYDTIRIGSVYGGGNGFYSYNGTSFAVATDATSTATVAAGGTVNEVAPGSTAGAAVWINSSTSSVTHPLPGIKKSDISVTSNLARIDSLFGGAKNAFITGAPSSTEEYVNTHVSVSGGTIFSVFGGNNYGGTLAAGSTQQIDISGTTMGVEPKIEWSDSREQYVRNMVGDFEGLNTYTSGFGRDYGIRYVFGGGNHVEGRNTVINFTGGQVDTMFAGGNDATVAGASVTVNSERKGGILTNAVYRWAFAAGDLTSEEQSRYTELYNNWSGTVASATLLAEYYALEDKMSVAQTMNGNYTWDGSSYYNIRTLFGGNDNAAMAVIPTLSLQSGSIGTVYGGGNSGAMTGSTYSVTLSGTATPPTTVASETKEIHYSTHVVTEEGSDNLFVDYLYGGCQKSNVDYSTWVQLKGGNIGTVYGGCNISGDVGSTRTNPSATLESDREGYYAVRGGTWVVASGGKVYKNLFAGSNGFYHCNDDVNYIAGIDYDDPEHLYLPSLSNGNTKTSVPTHNETHVRILDGVTVYGNVYAGGNLASVGFPSTLKSGQNFATVWPNYPVTCGLSSVRMDGGTVVKDVYGGGNMASIYGCNEVWISGGEIRGSLYGGNDRAGKVDAINNRKSLPTTASDTKTPTDAANLSTYVLVDGTAKIGIVYGGGNGDYDYSDNSDIKYCTDNIEDIMPIQRSTFVDINIQGGTSDDGGHIGTVYGGGDGVTVDGSITVFLNTQTAPDADEPFDNVGRIFGGNNKGDLATVPDIILKQGQVHNIYGGCNQGNMLGSETLFGYQGVSSYVRLMEEYEVAGETLPVNITVSGNVYGGCRLSNVEGNSLVLAEGGDLSTARIFGGNDISGQVQGTAFVTVDGTPTIKQIFGGGNGSYIYQSNGNVTFGSEVVATGNYSRPGCDSTDVKLVDGTCLANVYGGGLAGSCNRSRLVADGDAVVKGSLFGGGCGDTTMIGLSTSCVGEHVGNVTGTSHLELVSVNGTQSTSLKAYGGGHNGDCGNTDVKLRSTFRYPLHYLFGGCMASNVTGTATTVVDGYDDGTHTTVDTVFGGNDYSGKVQNTSLTINSGRFITAFGAGDGNYDYTGNWSVLRTGMQGTATADEPTVGEVLEGLSIKNGDPELVDFGTDYQHIVTSYTEGGVTKYNHSYRYWLHADGCLDTVPYSMMVDFTINGGTFLYSVYGGGFMGLVGNRDMVAADMGAYKSDNSYNTDRIADMGHINLNVHGGEFLRHIFAGASGRPGMKGLYFGSRNYSNALTGSTVGSPRNIDGAVMGHQLVYGTKILNMDGGHVTFSVYGGSESTDDGFPYECYGRRSPNLYTGYPHWKTIYLKDDKTATDEEPSGSHITYTPGDSNTTMRPSSIVNITGGIVDKSVYGGGYQGNIYGSVYVNIGRDAVDASPVWRTDYGAGTAEGTTQVQATDAEGYPIFVGGIPQMVTVGAPMAKYKPSLYYGNRLMLNASVYNASDWGDAGDTAYFTTRGVFGGVTNILIDGRGYRTGLNPAQSLLPNMNIAYSIIGAGTSTEGGDINRLITLRNYGDYFSCPNISKTLSSIQRADKVILDSVFLQLDGEQDAFSAYPTPNYTFCRVDTLLFREDNIVHITAPSIYIGHLVSMRDTVEVRDFTLTTTPAATSWTNSNNLVDNNKLYTNFMKENTRDNGGIDNANNTIANDFFDNLQNYNREPQSPYNVDANGCSVAYNDHGTMVYNHCESLNQCSRLRSERGHAGQMAAYNTLLLSNGSYMKVSPYIDMKNKQGNWMWNSSTQVLGRDGLDDVGHPWGHVHGWMYFVAFDETMNYIYADEKTNSRNDTDGGFVSTCDCNNIWTESIPGSSLRDDANDDHLHDSWELNYENIDVSASIPQPYRIWKVGRLRGVRKRHITLVANAEPDHILNEDVNTTSGDKHYKMQYPVVNNVNCEGSGTNYMRTSSAAAHNLPAGMEGVTATLDTAWLATQAYTIGHSGTGSDAVSLYSYANTTLELPPSAPGNFYIMTAPLIDLDNGGQITLTDQAYVYNPDNEDGVVFQAGDLYRQTAGGLYQTTSDGQGLEVNSTRTPMSAILSDPDYTFGLAFTTNYAASNFSTAAATWMSTAPADSLTAINSAVQENATGRTIKACHLDWPSSYISGNEFLTQAGGYVSKRVTGEEGVIPTIAFTLTYSRELSTTITRDVTFTLEEYSAKGEYIGPVEVTVTINTVIKDLNDLEADVLAMYNEGISNEYVRKVTIPACYVQRDIVLEGIEWDISSQIDGGRQPLARYMFNLQDTNTDIVNNRQFSLIVNPTNNTSENLVNHLGWYNIQTQNIDLFELARRDRTNNLSGYYTTTGVDVPTATEFNTDNASKYNSLNLTGATGSDPKVPSLMGSNPRSTGLLLGTIDGRATASIDITLLYDGLRVYEDFFDKTTTPPEGPLGEVVLHLHWYNTKITEEDILNNQTTDSTFDIKINLRTRKEGDTIYMAWGDPIRVASTDSDHGTGTGVSDINNIGKLRYWYTDIDGNEHEVQYSNSTGELDLPTGVTESRLYNKYQPYIQRYVDGQIATVHSFEWHKEHDGWELLDKKDQIYDNPDAYLRDFEEAMKIYKEGDVIDIMQTIPVVGGNNNAQAMGGLDYSAIQIIRYSGSHYKFPSLSCANYDPLIEVTNRLNMRNILFNGSGFTKVKKATPGNSVTVAQAAGKGIWHANSTGAAESTAKYTAVQQADESYKYYDPSGTEVSSTDKVPAGYYEFGIRQRVAMPVNAPVIYVHQGGQVTFNTNVSIINNVNLGEPAFRPQYQVVEYVDGEGNLYSSPGEGRQDTITLHRYLYGCPTYSIYPASTPTALIDDEHERARIPGGAVALVKDVDGQTPEMSLGSRCHIHDNAVVDPAYSSTTTRADAYPRANIIRNSGAGVYVYGGVLTVGSTDNVASVNIDHNYYVKTAKTANNAAASSQIATAFAADTAHSGTWGSAYDGVVSGRITNGGRHEVITTTVTSDGSGGFNAEEDTSYVYYYQLDTTGGRAEYMTFNNVQLTRTYNRLVYPKRYVRLDKMSDVVHFRGNLTRSSKIGISKWFPGYKYDGAGRYRTNNYQLSQQTGSYYTNKYHQLWDSIPRDTIAVARLTSSASVVASYVYDSAVFFNDSVFFGRNVSSASGDAAFVMGSGSNAYQVLYAADQNEATGQPGFNDHVYMFHHDYLDPNNIYFQRCASFGKGVTQNLVSIREWDDANSVWLNYYINDYKQGDSIAYWWNKDATCVASTDTVVFRMGGGFFPYSYHWDMDSVVFEKGETLHNYGGTALPSASDNTKSTTLALKRIPIRDRMTYGGNEVSDIGSARYDELRAKASIDTLVMSQLHMNQHLIKSTYLYECTAYDLTERCPVSQAVMVRVGKITSEGRTDDAHHHAGDYYIDSVNFLRHRNPYAAYANYKDEYSQHTGYYEEFPVSTGIFNNTDPFDPEQGTTARHDYAGDATLEAASLYHAGYPFYRVSAPGVDSSSFHDHVDHDSINCILRYNQLVEVFKNQHGDILFPYIRPFKINNGAPVLADVNNNLMRDTLGYEIRIPTYNSENTEITIHRYRWSKGSLEGESSTEGVYEKSATFDLSTDNLATVVTEYANFWNDLPWEYRGTSFTLNGVERAKEDFYPVRHVPHHTHGTGEGDNDAERGIRRAGYSHRPYHWFDHGYNRGTLAQRDSANNFEGKPYHDENMAVENGTNNVLYVTEQTNGEGNIVLDENDRPTWVDDATPHNPTRYRSQMVPRYLRVYRSYKISPHIVAVGSTPDIIEKSVAEGGEGAAVWAFESHETAFTEDNKIDLATAEFCPGGIVHLQPVHEAPDPDDSTSRSVDTTKWQYMAWSFDPSSPQNTNFVVSADKTKNSPIVYYSPGDYWHQVVTQYEDLGDHNYSQQAAVAAAWAGQSAAEGTTAHDNWLKTAYNLGPEATYTYNDGTTDHTVHNDYYEDYHGDITVFTEKGLAWLLSKVNGYNHQNAQTYRFNTITLDFDQVDMSAHKWLPMGNLQNNFEGIIKAAEGRTGNSKPEVTNIIVNERNLPFVGMFGYTDHADIDGFVLKDAFIRSNMYVGGLAGWADSSTTVSNVEVDHNYLFSEYVVGGLSGRATAGATFDGNTVNSLKLHGNAIYAGQGVGRLHESTFKNNNILLFDNSTDTTSNTMSAVFYPYYDPSSSSFNAVNYGGAAGEISDDGTYGNDDPNNPNGVGKKRRGRQGSKSGAVSVMNNNYVHISSGSGNLNVGGLVGKAAGVTMNNNYVYGDAKSGNYVGGLVGVVGNNVTISNCYYVSGMTEGFLGQNQGGTTPLKSATFWGSGNHVTTSQPIDGVSNLTRALNKWVDASGDTGYYHWRSDLEGENSGYPVFGTPDLIPIEDSLQLAVCDSYDLDGLLLTETGRYVFHWVDSAEYVDSIFTLNLTVNHSDSVTLSDTVVLGQGYHANGISLTAEQVSAIFGRDMSVEVVTMRHVDSLLNATGCDSVVNLTLYIVNTNVDVPEVVEELTDVKVYPNPTRGVVYVEGSDLKSVEVYDNISRRVLRQGEAQMGTGATKTSFDLSNHPAGAYYVRVRTAHGTVVKKVIKK